MPVRIRSIEPDMPQDDAEEEEGDAPIELQAIRRSARLLRQPISSVDEEDALYELELQRLRDNQGRTPPSTTNTIPRKYERLYVVKEIAGDPHQ
ncbi:MAG: hypothetical protein M1829_002463 [Trizodia sp. TS-e1964]|nr:MAG: hypothetical protein M1829_002463 [Trizodia sp. TS-e1964]